MKTGDSKEIGIIEELSMNALPSLQTLLYDGWIIRFADGYTKRANSVNPLYISNEDIDQKINTCENLFVMKSMRPVFKMTPNVYPANLDRILEEKEYQPVDYTRLYRFVQSRGR